MRRKRLNDVERLCEVSPSHQTLVQEEKRLMEKSTQLTRTRFWRCESWSVVTVQVWGTPPWWGTEMSHGHGCGVGVGVGMGVPFMTGFIRALPMVQPPVPTHASARFPSRHFDVVSAGLIRRQRTSRVKCRVPLPRNGFVNTHHKCQQLHFCVSAAVRCSRQHVGSDIIVWLKNFAFRFHLSGCVRCEGNRSFCWRQISLFFKLWM